MPLSSADIKRQILVNAINSPIRKKMESPPGISEGELIEIGNDLEGVTKQRGWTLVESYMLRRMNLVGLAMADKPDPDQKGIAKGFIELMQWIQLSIQKRDEILEKERHKNEAKTVQKEQESQGV
jgi:hypothetical protein